MRYMSSKKVLVIALQSDLHADSVISCLNKKGVDVFRIDPTIDDDLPEKVSIVSKPTIEAYYEFNDNKRINPMGCDGIFCRFAIDLLIIIRRPIEKFFISRIINCFSRSIKND